MKYWRFARSLSHLQSVDSSTLSTDLEKSLELNKKEFDNVTEFLTEQIIQCDQHLTVSRELKKVFQLANHAYDIPQQVSMVLQAFGVTKAEILSLDNKIYYMKGIHSNSYEGIKILKQSLDIFSRSGML